MKYVENIKNIRNIFICMFPMYSYTREACNRLSPIGCRQQLVANSLSPTPCR